MSEQFSISDMHDRLAMRVDRDAGLKKLSDIAYKYAYLDGKRYTTSQGHQYQEKILNDNSARVSVIKASQIGMTALQTVRLLCLASTLSHSRVLYAMPSQQMVFSYSKDRVDNAIEQSSYFAGLTTPAMNSASQKRLGTSTLVFTGTHSMSGVISQPCDVVILDEYDHMSEDMATVLYSRLRASHIVDERGTRGLMSFFSTPTASGFGVHKHFSESNQQYYQVKCEHCEHWQVCTPEHFRIPGYDGKILELTRNMAFNFKENIERSSVHCEKCDGDLQASLLTPNRREWVAKYPDRWASGYQIYPHDVPEIAIKPVAALTRQVFDYTSHSQYLNMVWGCTADNSDTSWNTSPAYRDKVTQAHYQPYRPGMEPYAGATAAGIDVGKTCWVTVFRFKDGKHHLVNAMPVENTQANPALPQLLDILRAYNSVQTIIDSGPDITLVNQLLDLRPEALAAVYVRSIQGADLFRIAEGKQQINIDRTKALDYFMAEHNSGRILYPQAPTLETVFEHLSTTKKIRTTDSDGRSVEKFVSSSPDDHYTHAMLYGISASEIAFGLFTEGGQIYAPVSVGVTRIGGNTEADKEQAEKDRLKKFLIW